MVLFFSPIQRAADRANWHHPTALISISHWLVTLLPGRSTNFWPRPLCTLDRNLAFPTKCQRYPHPSPSQKKKENGSKNVALALICSMKVRRRSKFWSDSRRSEWNLFRVSQRGSCLRVKLLRGDGVLELEKAKVWGLCRCEHWGFRSELGSRLSLEGLRWLEGGLE